MSNLSDLLPSGAGGKSFNFVASGTLASGQTVALTSDGKVEAVAGSATGVGSTATITSNTGRQPVGAYDTGQDKVVVAYTDISNNAYMTVVVGTPSGNNGLTFGTPVVVNSAYAYWMMATFDSNAGKTLIGGQDGSNSYNGAFFAVTVSGTTPSVGAKTSFFSAAMQLSSSYDTNAQKILVTCSENGNSNYGAAAVATISGTSVSFGSKLTFNSSDTRYSQNSYNTNAQKTLVGYIHQANQYYRCRILTITGTSVATSDFFNIYAGAVKMAPVGLSYEPTNYNHIGVFADNTSNAFIGKAGPMSVNNTEIYFGADVAISPASGFDYLSGKVSILYYPDAAKHIVTYGNSANTKIYYRALTAGSSTFTVGAKTELVTTVGSGSGAYETDLTYNPDQGNLIYSYTDSAATDAEAVAFSIGSTNSSSFVGITEAAISDTATGTVTLQGGINTKVTGLTVGSTYYVQVDGTLGTGSTSIEAGEALSATSINLVNT